MQAIACQQSRSVCLAAARPARYATRAVRALGNRPTAMPGRVARPSRSLMVKAAAKEEIDFDKFLIQLATKWEESDNKPVVVGYSAAFVLGFFFLEWFIHLPGFNFLLGFPIQLLGVLTLPWLTVRWLVDNKDWYEDTSSAVGYVVSKLPYLEKEKK